MAEEIMLNAEQNQHSELEDRYLLFYIQDMLYRAFRHGDYLL